jgi:phytoene/squalene synthetase
VKLRYADWRDLIEGYCMLSAAPVGRYLLDLHGEARSGYRASDALCNALQVLNHLQDCQDDHRQLNRVYLPQDWLAAARSRVEDLDASAASAGMRRVIDQCLDGSDELIAIARTLPGQLGNRRLAMESAVIVRIAERLSRLLRRRDPLAGRVKLSGLQFLGCGVTGIASTLLGRRG